MAHSAWHSSDLVHRVTDRRAVFNAISLLTTLKSPTFVWRGHVSSNWTLNPAVHRKRDLKSQGQILDDQLTLIESARDRRHDHLDGWRMPDLALLARLQHNGAATLLTDVTTDPFVALYFACERSSSFDQGDGLLLAIDVASTGKHPRTKHYDLAHEADLEEVLLDLDGRLGLYTPPDVSPRIMAQRGRFVFGDYRDLKYTTLPIHRSDWNAEKLEKVFSPERGHGQPPKPAIVAIEIKASLKPQLRDILDQSFGMTGITLFPDLHGFAAAHRVW